MKLNFQRRHSVVKVFGSKGLAAFIRQPTVQSAVYLAAKEGVLQFHRDAGCAMREHRDRGRKGIIVKSEEEDPT